MSADSKEVFACYRFDGLARWTSRSVGAWYADIEVISGYAKHAITTSNDAEAVSSLRQYLDYISSADFSGYIHELRTQGDQVLSGA